MNRNVALILIGAVVGLILAAFVQASGGVDLTQELINLLNL